MQKSVKFALIHKARKITLSIAINA